MLGARGTNAKLLFDEAKPGQSAFHPETPIIIGAGALAGTGVFGASKLEVTTRYALEVPDTLYGGFTSGGFFAPEMKFAGYDNIVIKGRAKIKKNPNRITSRILTFQNLCFLDGSSNNCSYSATP